MSPSVRRVAYLVAGALVLCGCGGGSRNPEPSASPSVTSSPTASAQSIPTPTKAAEAGKWAWEKVSAAPMGPWLQVVTSWTGKEIVAFAGDTACPPGTQCPAPKVKPERGGAAYDPERDAWRELAPAPFSLFRASAAVIGRTVFVLAPANNEARLPEFYAYSLDEKGWRRLPDPPIAPNAGAPSAIAGAGDRLVAWDPFPTKNDPTDLRFNPSTDEWTIVPADPWGRGQERTVLGLPDGRAVALSAPLPAPPDPAGTRPPRFWRAAVLDAEGREWQQLPPSPIAVSPISSLGHGRWLAAGGRIVNPEVGTVKAAPGGPQAPGQDSLPTGGILDPEARTWSALPERPARKNALTRAADPWEWAGGAGGDFAVLRGWIYDVARNAWTEVPPVPESPPEGLRDPAAAWVEDRLYVWGGLPGARSTATGWVLRPE